MHIHICEKLFTKTQSLNSALALQAHFLAWRLMDFGASGTGVRQSQVRLERPGGATRQGWSLTMKCQLDGS